MSLFEQLDSNRPLLMAILNITPDSFSDGGALFVSGKTDLDSVLTKAEAMLKAGADILDIGGESTRPGAIRPSLQEEMDRVIPVVEALSRRFDCALSVDTSQVEVMREAVLSGANLINDVRALAQEGAVEFVSESGVSVCLMHMQGEPSSMQENPSYADPVAEVYEFLSDRVNACLNAGIKRQNIAVDPGFGFGKSHAHNMALMANLEQFAKLGLPILVGISRKGMIGEITSKPIESRLAGSLAMAQIALQNGANILRVHDVDETCDMIKVWTAIEQTQEKQ